jgi:hypothetical protein
MELERVAAQHRRMGREDPEALVLPPDVFGAALVVRDAETPLAFAAFETPIAEQRSKDDLDLHRIRHDAPEHALWMLPHDMNVGMGLPALGDSQERLGDDLLLVIVQPSLLGQRSLHVLGHGFVRHLVLSPATRPPHHDDRHVK